MRRLKSSSPNRFTRITLRSGELPEVGGSVPVDSDSLRAEQLAMPVGRLTGLLEAIQQGEWKAGDRVIHYMQEPFSDHPRPHDMWNTWTYPRGSGTTTSTVAMAGFASGIGSRTPGLPIRF
jgi:hypothetical protein